MGDIMIILYLLISYLFGSIPWALIVGKVFYHTDIRQHGSGNLGGTNAGRVLGKKAGIMVMALDVLKALIVVIALSFIDKNTAILSGLACTFGHCFPIFAGFRGGKGVATTTAYLLGVSIFCTHNVLLQFCLPLAVFLVILYLTKMVSLASMSAAALAALVSYFQPNVLFSVCITILALFIIFQHRANIQRIISGTERKITWM
jgi:acyl-phosphate glycerol 3-phosphate acyltransferase